MFARGELDCLQFNESNYELVVDGGHFNIEIGVANIQLNVTREAWPSPWWEYVLRISI